MSVIAINEPKRDEFVNLAYVPVGTMAIGHNTGELVVKVNNDLLYSLDSGNTWNLNHFYPHNRNTTVSCMGKVLPSGTEVTFKVD